MADVFISYSQKDRQVARALADFLNDHGYNIWWDYELVGGVKFRNAIKAELSAARAAIVIWTTNSIESDWVIEEAEEAKYSDKLIATRVDGLDFRSIPLGFRGLQTDFVTEPERILKALAHLGVSPSHPPAAPSPAPVAIGKTLDPEAIAKAEQFAHWEFIKDSEDPAGYDRFLQMFPTSSFAALARAQLEKLAARTWQNLCGSEDIAALEGFVRTFPQDARAAEATGRLRLLGDRTEEAASWDRIKETDDLAVVEAHIARFPDGLNAPAAEAKREALRRERQAGERWRRIGGAQDTAAIEEFLTSYPDSRFAPEARARLEEMNRAREDDDWNTARRERHPAPLLRFLVAHPMGIHAADAVAALTNLPKTVEDEAWAVVKDSDEPIVLGAFLAALPKSDHARAVRTRLKTTKAGQAPPARPTTTAAAPEEDNRQKIPLPGRGKRIAFWVFIAFLIVIVIFSTGSVFAQMRYPYAAASVAGGIATASVFLGVIALLLFFIGPKLYPPATGQRPQRMLLFHAIGSIGILLWMTMTQSFGEANHLNFAGNIDNVRMNVQGEYATMTIIAAIVARIALALGNRWWARIMYYLVLLVIGLLATGHNWSGYGARDYWVTANLAFCGGLALILFSIVGLLWDGRVKYAAMKKSASAPPATVP